jgi:hypothetical protein
MNTMEDKIAQPRDHSWMPKPTRKNQEKNLTFLIIIIVVPTILMVIPFSPHSRVINLQSH